MAEVIRIFIGASPNNCDLESQAVLEWSLRKYHPADDLEITWMQLTSDPTSIWYSDPARRKGWNTISWSTPFSGFRWAVPYACSYQGKAIYMDSDMIARTDIAELWNQEFIGNAPVISKGCNNARYCVSLFDCARMRRFCPPLETMRSTPLGYMQVRRQIMPRTQPFRGNWNCCDGEAYQDINDPDIKMIHYTSIPHQLHLKHSLPRLKAEGGKHWFSGRTQAHWKPGLQNLFDDLLAEAIANGYSPEKYRRELFGEYRTKWAA